jgi:hypothetical protein
VSDPITTRFEAFADAHRDGVHPDPVAVIQAAPEADREALGVMIATYLAAHPTAVSADAVARRAADPASDPPLAWSELLPALRAQTGTTRSALVTKLAAALGYPSATEQVEEHVHHLETGQLQPTRVKAAVVEALANLLGVPKALLERGRLAAPRPSVLLASAPIYRRMAAPMQSHDEVLGDSAPPSRIAAIDELFGADGG